ncbi:hypothetical protein MHYP_G00080420 [Metynnis hypsauchen]
MLLPAVCTQDFTPTVTRVHVNVVRSAAVGLARHCSEDYTTQKAPRRTTSWLPALGECFSFKQTQHGRWRREECKGKEERKKRGRSGGGICTHRERCVSLTSFYVSVNSGLYCLPGDRCKELNKPRETQKFQ